MTRDVLMDIFKRIPELEHSKMQLIMRTGPALSIETILRYEPSYILMRGREAGNQDDGRAFFVPYEEVVSIKIESTVKLADLHAWYSDRPRIERHDVPAVVLADTDATTQPTVAAISNDPAEIAKQNLLDRIRATRTSVNTNKTVGGKT